MAGTTVRDAERHGEGDRWPVRAQPPGRRAAAPIGAPVVPGYLLCDKIREGGQGTVWAGSREDGLDVALKVIAGGARRPEARQEAEVLAALDLEHLVRLHDVLEVGADLVLVLDLMRGGSLADVVSARGHLTPGECITVLTPLLSALGRLHRVGVAHADVSPSNVLFDLQGRPHLGDLGEAVIAGRRIEDGGATLGFVAPEVLLGERPGPAADVYAVGALGRFCLTGRTPPSALAGPTAAPSGDDPQARIMRLCLAAMATDPDARPGADSLAVDLYSVTEPLHLVSSVDPGADVTRRLREVAGLTSAPVGPSSLSARRREAGSGPETGARRQAVVRSASRIALACVLVSGLWILGTALGDGTSEATPAAASRPSRTTLITPSATSSSTSAPSASTAAAPRSAVGESDPTPTSVPGMVPGNSRAEALATIEALAEVRAQLWSDPTSGDLSLLDVSGSPAWESDTADRAARAQAGVRLEGLAFEVIQAQPEVEGPDTLTVRVTLGTSAHTEHSASGVRSVSASVADPVLLELQRTPEGWRIARIVAAT